MPSPAIESTLAAQDKALSALRQSQAAVVDVVESWAKAVESSVQDLPAIPVAELPADARGDHQDQLRLRGQGARTRSASSPRSS